MPLLEEAASWLAAECRSALAVKIRWIPRHGVERTVDAVVGRTVFRAEGEYGVTVRTESRDFIVTSDQMPEEPMKGDMVVWGSMAYEVLAPGGEPVWRWSDGYRNARRIHTKEAGETGEEETEDDQ